MIPNTTPPNVPTEQKSGRRLTVQLRGRTEAPDGGEGAQSLSARGAKPQAHHGSYQRLLGALSHSDKVWDSNKR